MKVILISDTHCLHRKLKLPEADMIIHCGDFSHRGRPLEVFDFLDWYSKLSYKYKVLVCGNHELGLDSASNVRKHLRGNFIEECKIQGVHYLEQEHKVIAGYKFFGSPYTPEFCSWGFMYPRTQGKEYWNNIEKDTEIIITHGPPYSIQDPDRNGISVGCNDLYNKIQELPNLKLVASGHLHMGYGQTTQNGVLFVNASSCTDEYKLRKKPYHLIELEDKNG